MTELTIERKNVPGEGIAFDDDTGTFEAIVSVTNVIDEVGDVIRPGAYQKTLTMRNPKVCWGHDWKSPVGKILEAKELMPGDARLPARLIGLNAGGLWVKGQFNLKTARGRDAYEDVKFWATEGEWSIGYDCSGSNGKAWKNEKTGAREIDELALFEISPVLFGANAHTGTLMIKEIAAIPATADILESLSLKDLRDFLVERVGRAEVKAVDENVGGGVDRDKLPNSDFVFPDTRTFPVVKPGDVSDAVTGWGRYEGDETFDTFKAKLSALAKRKGESFVEQLPDSWVAKPAKSLEVKAHTHSHVHDGGVSHSHEHVHALGEYGHDPTDPEVHHEHDHSKGFDAWVATQLKNIEPAEPEIKGAPVTDTATTPTQSKMWVNLEGSFEDTIQDLNEALDRWLSEAMPGSCYNWIEATFPDYAIIGVGSGDGDWDDSPCVEFWKVPYTIDADDVVTLGQPNAVDVQGVAVDRPADGGEGEVEFLPEAKVILSGVATKNATRLRRRYALLAHAGVDVSASGLTPDQVGLGAGGGSIPAESDPDSFDSVTNMSVPETTVRGSSSPGMAGDQQAPAIQLLSGTYWVDNAGNLTASPVSAVFTAAGHSSSQSAPAVPDQGHFDDNPASNVAPSTTPAMGGPGDIGVIPGKDGEGDVETKGATRIRKRARLLGQLNGTAYRAAGGPAAAAASTSSLMAHSAALMKSAGELFTAVKEGRMLNSFNSDRIKAAHSALAEVLAAAGVDQPNEVAGEDEDGAPIETDDAKGAVESSEVKSLDPFELNVMEWEQARTAVSTR